MPRRLQLLTASLACLTAAPALAQESSFEIVPVVGAYLPTGALARGSLTEPGGGVTDIAVDQNTGFLLGIRIGNWWSRVFGWEGAFSYVQSDLDVRANDGSGEQSLCDSGLDCGGDMWTFTSRINARWFPGSATRWYLFGSAGLAVVGHVGDVWERGQATTDLGGVFAIGAALDLSDRLALRLDVEDYLYTYKPSIDDDPDLGTLDGEARTQNDIAISAGVIIRLFGR